MLPEKAINFERCDPRQIAGASPNLEPRLPASTNATQARRDAGARDQQTRLRCVHQLQSVQLNAVWAELQAEPLHEEDPMRRMRNSLWS